MFARRLPRTLLLLAVFMGCMAGPEEEYTFPTYIQASRTLPGDVATRPVFSHDGRYGIAAAADTLYHLELRHGRIHGRTPMGETVIALAAGQGEAVFVAGGETIYKVEGFAVTGQAYVGSAIEHLTVSGNDPVAATEDGMIRLYRGSDMTLLAQSDPLAGVSHMEGFPGMVVIVTEGQNMITLSLPEMRETASYEPGSEILFLSSAGGHTLLFSTTQWNEVALCMPENLVITQMFTFPESPSEAAADSGITFVMAFEPGSGLAVCTANGSIAWRSPGYGGVSWIALTDSGDKALIVSGNRIDLLIE